MTKEEIKSLAEKILLGTATEEDLILYNRICDVAEKNEQGYLPLIQGVIPIRKQCNKGS